MVNKTYYTKISGDELLNARTDDLLMSDILKRLEKYITYVSGQIYQFYGIKFDRSIDFEDVQCFCRINIMRSIRYFNPGQYNKKKDKRHREYYKDGFMYIYHTTNKWIRKMKTHQDRKKRIPPCIIDSMEQPIRWNDNDILIGDLVICNIKEKDKKNEAVSMILSFYINSVLKHFEHKSANGIRLYEIVYALIQTNKDIKTISKEFKINYNKLKKIITSYIVPELKNITFGD